MTDTATVPALGLPAIEDAKEQPGDLRFWSVTEVLKAIGSSEGLVNWAANETAWGAIRDRKIWLSRLEHEGEDAAFAYIKDARWRREGLSDAELGKAVHAAAEDYIKSGTRPEMIAEARPFFDQLDRWIQRFQPTYDAAEVAVFDTRYGYAGTSDAFIRLDGYRAITDYKTSRKDLDGRGKPRKPYAETAALQIAAYRYAELAAVWRPRRFDYWRRRYYLLSSAEQEQAVPVPEVDGGLVFYITPQRCEAYPMRCDERVWETFLHSLEIARWVFQDSKLVMGDPLEPPARHLQVVG